MVTGWVRRRACRKRLVPANAVIVRTETKRPLHGAAASGDEEAAAAIMSLATFLLSHT